MNNSTEKPIVYFVQRVDDAGNVVGYELLVPAAALTEVPDSSEFHRKLALNLSVSEGSSANLMEELINFYNGEASDGVGDYADGYKPDQDDNYFIFESADGLLTVEAEKQDDGSVDFIIRDYLENRDGSELISGPELLVEFLVAAVDGGEAVDVREATLGENDEFSEVVHEDEIVYQLQGSPITLAASSAVELEDQDVGTPGGVTISVVGSDESRALAGDELTLDLSGGYARDGSNLLYNEVIIGRLSDLPDENIIQIVFTENSTAEHINNLLSSIKFFSTSSDMQSRTVYFSVAKNGDIVKLVQFGIEVGNPQEPADVDPANLNWSVEFDNDNDEDPLNTNEIFDSVDENSTVVVRVAVIGLKSGEYSDVHIDFSNELGEQYLDGIIDAIIENNNVQGIDESGNVISSDTESGYTGLSKVRFLGSDEAADSGMPVFFEFEHTIGDVDGPNDSYLIATIGKLLDNNTQKILADASASVSNNTPEDDSNTVEINSADEFAWSVKFSYGDSEGEDPADVSLDDGIVTIAEGELVQMTISVDELSANSETTVYFSSQALNEPSPIINKIIGDLSEDNSRAEGDKKYPDVSLAFNTNSQIVGLKFKNDGESKNDFSLKIDYMHEVTANDDGNRDYSVELFSSEDQDELSPIATEVSTLRVTEPVSTDVDPDAQEVQVVKPNDVKWKLMISGPDAVSSVVEGESAQIRIDLINVSSNSETTIYFAKGFDTTSDDNYSPPIQAILNKVFESETPGVSVVSDENNSILGLKFHNPSETAKIVSVSAEYKPPKTDNVQEGDRNYALKFFNSAENQEKPISGLDGSLLVMDPVNNEPDTPEFSIDLNSSGEESFNQGDIVQYQITVVDDEKFLHIDFPGGEVKLLHNAESINPEADNPNVYKVVASGTYFVEIVKAPDVSNANDTVNLKLSLADSIDDLDGDTAKSPAEVAVFGNEVVDNEPAAPELSIDLNSSGEESFNQGDIVQYQITVVDDEEFLHIDFPGGEVKLLHNAGSINPEADNPNVYKVVASGTYFVEIVKAPDVSNANDTVNLKLSLADSIDDLDGDTAKSPAEVAVFGNEVVDNEPAAPEFSIDLESVDDGSGFSEGSIIEYSIMVSDGLGFLKIDFHGEVELLTGYIEGENEGSRVLTLAEALAGNANANHSDAYAVSPGTYHVRIVKAPDALDDNGEFELKLSLADNLDGFNDGDVKSPDVVNVRGTVIESEVDLAELSDFLVNDQAITDSGVEDGSKIDFTIEGKAEGSVTLRVDFGDTEAPTDFEAIISNLYSQIVLKTSATIVSESGYFAISFDVSADTKLDLSIQLKLFDPAKEEDETFSVALLDSDGKPIENQVQRIKIKADPEDNVVDDGPDTANQNLKLEASAAEAHEGESLTYTVTGDAGSTVYLQVEWDDLEPVMDLSNFMPRSVVGFQSEHNITVDGSSSTIYEFKLPGADSQSNQTAIELKFNFAEDSDIENGTPTNTEESFTVSLVDGTTNPQVIKDSDGNELTATGTILPNPATLPEKTYSIKLLDNNDNAIEDIYEGELSSGAKIQIQIDNLAAGESVSVFFADNASETWLDAKTASGFTIDNRVDLELDHSKKFIIGLKITQSPDTNSPIIFESFYNPVDTGVLEGSREVVLVLHDDEGESLTVKPDGSETAYMLHDPKVDTPPNTDPTLPAPGTELAIKLHEDSNVDNLTEGSFLLLNIDVNDVGVLSVDFLEGTAALLDPITRVEIAKDEASGNYIIGSLGSYILKIVDVNDNLDENTSTTLSLILRDPNSGKTASTSVEVFGSPATDNEGPEAPPASTEEPTEVDADYTIAGTGDDVRVSYREFQTFDLDNTPDEIIYNVTYPQGLDNANGYFYYHGNAASPLTQFTQDDVNKGKVYFHFNDTSLNNDLDAVPQITVSAEGDSAVQTLVVDYSVNGAQDTPNANTGTPSNGPGDFHSATDDPSVISLNSDDLLTSDSSAFSDVKLMVFDPEDVGSPEIVKFDLADLVGDSNFESNNETYSLKNKDEPGADNLYSYMRDMFGDGSTQGSRGIGDSVLKNFFNGFGEDLISSEDRFFIIEDNSYQGSSQPIYIIMIKDYKDTDYNHDDFSFLVSGPIVLTADQFDDKVITLDDKAFDLDNNLLDLSELLAEMDGKWEVVADKLGDKDKEGTVLKIKENGKTQYEIELEGVKYNKDILEELTQDNSAAKPTAGIYLGLRGDAEHNTLVGGKDDDALYGNGGNDTLHGNDGDDDLFGGSGHDHLYGGDDDDTLVGGEGNDYLCGGEDKDTLTGGSGADHFVFTKDDADGKKDKITDFELGVDTIDLSESVKYISEKDFEIKVTIDDGDTVIKIKDDGDTVHEIVILNQELTLDDLTDANSINLGAGYEQYSAELHASTHTEVDGDDVTTVYLYGDELADVNRATEDFYADFDKETQIIDISGLLRSIGVDAEVKAKESDDGDLVIKIKRHDGKDDTTVLEIKLGGVSYSKDKLEDLIDNGIIVTGMTGLEHNADVLYGTIDDDSLLGLSGNDILYAGDGNDKLKGGDGDDHLYSGEGDDKMTGGDGRDVFYATAEEDNNDRDTITDFNLTDDLIDLTQLLAKLGNDWEISAESKNDGEDTLLVVTDNGKTVHEILLENVEYSDTVLADLTHADSITRNTTGVDLGLKGDEKRDVLSGGAGDDVMYGNDANDLMRGHDGNDTMHGGAGSDVLYGGQGDDILYGESSDPTAVNPIHSNDQLRGEDGNDTLYGGFGIDWLYGGNGNDTIYAGEGDDNIDGGAGHDIIEAGAGDDNIETGGGNDVITGGEGSDAFNFTEADLDGAGSLTNPMAPGSIELTNLDRITDFSAGESDYIDLTQLLENKSSWIVEASAYDRIIDGVNVDGTLLSVKDPFDVIHRILLENVDYNDLVNSANEGSQTVVEYLVAQGQLRVPESGDVTPEAEVQPSSWSSVNGAGYHDWSTIIKQLGDTWSLTARAALDGKTEVILSGENNSGGSIAFGVKFTALDYYDGILDELLYVNTMHQLPIDTLAMDADGNLDWAQLTGKHHGIITGAKDYDGYDVGFQGGLDDDVIRGHVGHDEGLYGGAGNDFIDGGDGNDTLFGEAGDDKLEGGAGVDRLSGGDGDDALYGQDGNDELRGGRGNNRLVGGEGNDRFVFSAADIHPEHGTESRIDDFNANEDLIDLTDVIKSLGSTWELKLKQDGGDSILEIDSNGRTVYRLRLDGQRYDDDLLDRWLGNNEEGLHDSGILTGMKGVDDANSSDFITGGMGDDVIRGYAGDDVLQGAEGDDFIDGGAGDDILGSKDQGEGDDKIEGGTGDDVIYGGLGKDDLYGQDGDDTIYGGSGKDDIFGGDGVDRLYGGADNDELAGGSGNDTIYGEDGEDELHGDAGNDTLDGGLNKDILFGGDGDDLLYGGFNDDELHGGDDEDILYGGRGDDALYGGDGRDIFVISLDAIDLKDAEKDIIYDFDRKGDDSDIINLAGFLDNLNPDDKDADWEIKLDENDDGDSVLLKIRDGDGDTRHRIELNDVEFKDKYSDWKWKDDAAKILEEFNISITE